MAEDIVLKHTTLTQQLEEVALSTPDNTYVQLSGDHQFSVQMWDV